MGGASWDAFYSRRAELVASPAILLAFLAIDPGATSGWALFDSARRLTACGLGVETPSSQFLNSKNGVFDLAEVIIECEQLHGRSEQNPNSILLMARNAGEWFGRCSEYCENVRYIRVADWKGNTPKDINHRRSFEKLDPAELKALVAGCTGVSPKSAAVDVAIRKGLTTSDKRGNILDAIGIGLWGVGR